MKKEQASNTDKELVMLLMRQLEGKEEMIKDLLERIDSPEATMQKMTDELSALCRICTLAPAVKRFTRTDRTSIVQPSIERLQPGVSVRSRHIV